MDGSTVFARWRQCAPPSNTCFHGPTPFHIPNNFSIGSAVFAQFKADSPYTLQWAAPSPLKFPLHMGCGIWPPSNTWFLGPPGSRTQISSGSHQPFLQGSRSWQTDRPHSTRSVTVGHIYVRSTAMWPTRAVKPVCKHGCMHLCKCIAVWGLCGWVVARWIAKKRT